MYKSQMKFQKIICYLVLVASALVFVYSLGMVTNLYEAFYFTMTNPKDYTKTKVPGSIIFYDIQDFNKMLTVVGLALILVSLLLLVMNTHIRRKYYAGNYVAIGLSAVANIGAAVWTLINVLKYKTQYLTTVDFEKLKEFGEKHKTPGEKDVFWFNAGIVVSVLLIVATVLLVVNLIWKIRVVNAENKLIAEGKE